MGMFGDGGMETNDEEVSVVLVWGNDDILALWSMALSPAGEPGTIDVF